MRSRSLGSKVFTAVGWGVVTILLLLNGALGTITERRQCTFFVREGFVPRPGTLRDGRSPESAFDSVGEAALLLDNPGEAVCVGPGEYLEGNLAPPLDGVSGRAIVFFADRDGNLTGDEPGPVILRPPRLPNIEDIPTVGFLLLGRREVVIEGFEISGFVDAGIQVRSAVSGPANSSDIVVREVVTTRNGGAGIEISGEGDILVEGCTAIDNEGSGISLIGCVKVSESGRCRATPSDPVRPIVRGNTLAGNLAHGVFVRDAIDGIVIDNRIVSNGVGLGAGVTLRATERFQLVNNLIYDSFESGIAVGTFALGSPGTTIIGNTIYANEGWGIEIGSAGGDSGDATIADNIILDNSNGSIAVTKGSTCGYVSGFNLVQSPFGPDTPVNVFEILVDDSVGIFSDAAGRDGTLGGVRIAGRFVDRSGDDDFSLIQSPSDPAIDAGHVSVEDLNWGGVTSPSGTADSDTVDLGYHAGFPADLPPPLSVPEIRMSLYVRSNGSNAGDGRKPESAMASIGTAARSAKAGVRVVVGAGLYIESGIGPPQFGGKATFIADPLGTETGDDPGLVVVDPSRVSIPGDLREGFRLVSACKAIIDGFHVWNANDSGIQVRDGSDGSVIRNNIVFTSDGGIDVRDSLSVTVVNNLVYDNTTGGITINLSSSGADVSNNTLYANLGGNGISILSPRARVEFNIIVGNSGNGINLRPEAESGYFARYNLLRDNGEGNWGGAAERGVGSLSEVAPLFLNPSGEDGVIGGGSVSSGVEYFRDDQFQLKQVQAGQEEDSVAVDYAPITAAQASLSSRTTRSDLGADRDALDLGFHYLTPPPEVLYVDPLLGDDSFSGLLPNRPLRTIKEAFDRSEEGSRIQLVAATYFESDLRPPLGVSIVGPGEGLARIDADGADIAFDLRQPDVRLLGLEIVGATSAAVRIRADNVVVGNSWLHSNPDNGKGVLLLSGAGTLLFNNAIYRNGSTGVIVGGRTTTVLRATIAHNTIFANGVFGAAIGIDSDVRRVALFNNVVSGHEAKGISVGMGVVPTFEMGNNCNDDGYAGVVAGPTDVTVDPMLLAPEDATPDFRLAQKSSGQGETSRCVDAGKGSAAALGIHRSTTRSDNRVDEGVADVGYHYMLDELDVEAILSELGPEGLASDCDGDDRVSINELVLAVSIALEVRALEECPVADPNGDGRVSVAELIKAVRSALSG